MISLDQGLGQALVVSVGLDLKDHGAASKSTSDPNTGGDSVPKHPRLSSIRTRFFEHVK